MVGASLAGADRAAGAKRGDRRSRSSFGAGGVAPSIVVAGAERSRGGSATAGGGGTAGVERASDG